MGNNQSDLSNLVNADSLAAKEDDNGRPSVNTSDYQQEEATAQDAEILIRTPVMRPRIVDYPYSEPAPLRPRSSLDNPATSGLVTAEDDIALIKKPKKSKQSPTQSDRVLRSSKLFSNYGNAIPHAAHGAFGESRTTVSREEENASEYNLCQSFNSLDIGDDLTTHTDGGTGDNTPASSRKGYLVKDDHIFIQRRDFTNFEKYKEDLSTAVINAQILRCLVEPATTRSESKPDYRMKDGCIYVIRIIGYPGYVKIGRTTRPPAERLREHLKCGYNMDSKFFEVSCYQRLETIIKYELHNKRRTFSCLPCGEKHVEWFKMDYQEAVYTVEKWCRWMNQRPYGADNLLSFEWQERVSGGVRNILGF